MYNYSKKTIIVNFTFALFLILLTIFSGGSEFFRIALGIVAILVIRDAMREMNAGFELKNDRLVVTNSGKLVKEIKYKEMKYLTITRKNKKWAVIADDNGILFTIKPKIQNYEKMVSELININKKNKKLVVHELIKKEYHK